MSARLTDRDRLLRSIPEAAFQAQLEGLLALRVRDGRSVYIECKRVGERPSAEQVMVLSLLHDAGNEVYLFDSTDWDFIEDVLSPPWAAVGRLA